MWCGQVAALSPGQSSIILGLSLRLTPKGVVFSVHDTLVVWTGGSSGWQAPEQLIARSGGEARQGYSTDVFSYGMLLFYCLTAGKHPFGHHYERDFNILQVTSCTACSAQPAHFVC